MSRVSPFFHGLPWVNSNAVLLLRKFVCHFAWVRNLTFCKYFHWIKRNRDSSFWSFLASLKVATLFSNLFYASNKHATNILTSCHGAIFGRVIRREYIWDMWCTRHDLTYLLEVVNESTQTWIERAFAMVQCLWERHITDIQVKIWNAAEKNMWRIY
jgi:hypothetical protein